MRVEDAPARAVDDDTSRQIRYARVLGIVFMSYIHVNPGPIQVESAPGIVGVVGRILSGVLATASVPALSVVSGFLVVSSLGRRPYRRFLGGRFVQLIVPMAVWNTVAIGIGLAAVATLGLHTFALDAVRDTSVREIVLGRVFALDYTSATAGFNFLRDVFVCAALAPLLVWAARRSLWGTVAVVWGLGLTVGFAPLVYRPHILMFFVAGIAVACGPGDFRWLRRAGIPCLIGLVVVAAVRADLGVYTALDGDGMAWQTVERCVVSLGLLALALRLARRSRCPVLLRLEPNIFFVFLSHPVGFLLLWAGWQAVAGRSLGPTYLVFYLAAPVVWVLLAQPLRGLLDRLPVVARMLLTGRAAPARRSRAAADGR